MPYRINVIELLARPYVNSCIHFQVCSCAKMCFNKKVPLKENNITYLYKALPYFRTVKHFANNAHLYHGMHPISLIASQKGTSSYIPSTWPTYV